MSSILIDPKLRNAGVILAPAPQNLIDSTTAKLKQTQSVKRRQSVRAFQAQNKIAVPEHPAKQARRFIPHSRKVMTHVASQSYSLSQS